MYASPYWTLSAELKAAGFLTPAEAHEQLDRLRGPILTPDQCVAQRETVRRADAEWNAGRAQRRAAEQARIEKERRRHREMDLAPESQAELERRRQARLDADHAAWAASGEPDVLAELMLKRRAKRAAANVDAATIKTAIEVKPMTTPPSLPVPSNWNPLAAARGEIEFIPADADESLTAQFTAKHAGNLRYVAAWGRWLEWDGSRWRFDDTLRAYDLARAVCRDVANVVDPRAGKQIASARTVAAVERMAKSDRRIAATIDQWDSDPWLLNTPGGVVDLRTGQMRDATPDDYMTKSTAVAPGGECPTWLAFLNRVADGNSELIEFLQLALGYSLTGVTREHAMFFLYGTGANGKSVLLSTIAGILRDYHTTAPIETFTASASERHPTDLAGLRGARLVTATETEEGRRWAEAKIKALTGGDKIAARFMRQDFFEFVPQFKLAIAGNHKPGLRAVDEAIRRRIHLIPFTVTIPPHERDHTLTERLRAEWPGILAWMVEGCRKWQAQGLHPPEAVRAATAAYLDSEDAIGSWFEDKCERDPMAFTTREQLFGSWSVWANAAGEFVGSSRRFLSALEAKGFESGRQNNRRGFRGVRLKATPFFPPPPC